MKTILSKLLAPALMLAALQSLAGCVNESTVPTRTVYVEASRTVYVEPGRTVVTDPIRPVYEQSY